MRLWELDVPSRSEFARFMSIYVKETTLACGDCGWPVIPNLLVEWEDGSDVIGDFTSAGARIVVKESVADELLEQFDGFEKAPIKMLDHPALYRPKRITKRTPKRVYLPYEGPPLCELRVTREVPLAKKSTVTVERECPTCGAIVYKSFQGMERITSREHTPREPGKGFFVKRADIGEYDFFKPKYTGVTLCTNAVKRFITKHGYSNIEFLDVGDSVK